MNELAAKLTPGVSSAANNFFREGPVSNVVSHCSIELKIDTKQQ